MITQSELDGIPVLHTPMPGPVSAGLVFRVGQADEGLPQRGITHMVEHLALHRQGVGDIDHNGATADLFTHFLVRGTESEVVEYLNGVCAALADLPLQRLATEKEILRTEAARRGTAPVRELPLWRYGARGHGIGVYPEWGLEGLTGEQVANWAARWFTRGNAVLWITAETLPEGLALKLPEGGRKPLPDVTGALPQTPAYFAAGEGAVAVDGIVRRSTPAMLFGRLLGRELFRALRQQGGYSYTAESDYTPRDGEYARILGYADALPEKQDAVLGGFVDVLAKLRRGRIEQADLDALRQQALARMDEPDSEAKGLPARAMELLLGNPPVDRERLRAELAAVTVEDLHAVAGELAASALLMVPQGHGADWAGFAAAPATSAEAVVGVPYRRKDGRPARLVVAADGISVADGKDQLTVLWKQCAAVLVYPDGARHLIGDDGVRVAYEPTLYEAPTGLGASIDARIPTGLLIRMPARTAGQIPRPRPMDPDRERARPASGLRRYPGVMLAIAMTESSGGGWGTAAVLLVVAALFGRAGLSSTAGANGSAFVALALVAGVAGLAMGAGTANVWWRRRRRRSAG